MFRSRRSGLVRLLLLLVLVMPPLAAAATAPGILVLGDSLSAGFGLQRERGWVALLQVRLNEQGYPHRVINASVTGETTAGGLARLPRLLQRHRPQYVLIELGANDGLRGLPVEALRANLERMVDLTRAADARPVLFAMQIPPNYGARYAENFRETFLQVARQRKALLVPFFLERFALDSGYFQDDATHPNERAQPLMLAAVWETLEPELRKMRAALKPPAAAPSPAVD